MKELKFRAWDGKQFYIPILYSGSVYRNDRDFEDGIDYTDQVMQYTGLHDKNGREIYEGDILRIISNFELRKDITQQAVTYDHWSFGTDEWALFELVRNQKKGEQVFEVIGNIYENPDIDFE